MIKILRNKINQRASVKGLTLVEVLVSVFVLSIVIAGLIRLYYLSVYQTNMARHKIMAVNLAQASLENLLNTTYANIVTANYPLVQNVVIDPGKLDDASDDLAGTITTELVNFNINQGYKFIVTVAWNEAFRGQSGQFTEVAETLITSY